MRIAVCFIGMIRTGPETAGNLRNWFRGVYQDIDFFMHTWDVSESKLWHCESRYTIENIRPQNLYREPSYPLIEKMESSYDRKFISIEVENQDKFISSKFFSRYVGFSPQWYSWYKVMNLVEQHEKLNNFKYDLVVKIRPDIMFPKERNLREEILRYYGDMTALYTLGYDPVRIDDVMFLGSSSVMNRASKFMIDSSKFIWETNILGEWLELKKIKALNTAYTIYSIYRKEHIELGVNPMQFNKCVNIDREFYAPYNVDRLSEDGE